MRAQPSLPHIISSSSSSLTVLHSVGSTASSSPSLSHCALCGSVDRRKRGAGGVMFLRYERRNAVEPEAQQGGRVGLTEMEAQLQAPAGSEPPSGGGRLTSSSICPVRLKITTLRCEAKERRARECEWG